MFLKYETYYALGLPVMGKIMGLISKSRQHKILALSAL